MKRALGSASGYTDKEAHRFFNIAVTSTTTLVGLYLDRQGLISYYSDKDLTGALLECLRNGSEYVKN